jgi:antitoxin ParD1/3/4
MNVTLTRELDGFVTRQVESGRYRSAGEMMREALQLLQAREQALAPTSDELEQRLLAGLDSPQKKVSKAFFRDLRRRAAQRLVSTTTA